MGDLELRLDGVLAASVVLFFSLFLSSWDSIEWLW